MIRPRSFGFNAQTFSTNAFQKKSDLQNVRELAQAEFDEMVRLLRLNDINLEVFEDIEDGLPDSVFSNNWMAHLPEKWSVVFPMFTPNRRAEVREDILNWIDHHLESKRRIDLTPQAIHNRFLEGTGSVVFDYRSKVAYACESPRTSIELFEEFCSMIGYRPVSFQSTDVSGKLIYHTNVMMTVADKFAMVCLESVENLVERRMLEMRLVESGHELIVLSHQQMNQFSGNCIEVLNRQNESLLLLSQTALESLTEFQIDQIKRYSKILPISIPVIEGIGGGSVRCMITGLFR